MKTNDYKRAFMYLLLKYYDLYLNEGLNQPEKIKEYSKEYKRKLARDAEWFDSMLLKKKVGGVNIKVSKVCDMFSADSHKNWSSHYMAEKLKEFGYEVKRGRTKHYDHYGKVWRNDSGNGNLSVVGVMPTWIDEN